MDDMGDANILLKFREKKTKEERERVIFSYFFLDLSCITKHPFNQSNEKLTKNKINIFLQLELVWQILYIFAPYPEN